MAAKLDADCCLTLQEMDAIICEQNWGRTPPYRELAELDEWYSHEQYFRNSCAARWMLADTFFYMATEPFAHGLGEDASSSLSYTDNWTEWNQAKREAVATTVLMFWHHLLELPAGEPAPGSSDLDWRQSYAGRFFEFVDLFVLC